MPQIDAHDAETRLFELLDRIESGEELVIARHGRPVARLVPVADAQQPFAAQAVRRLCELRRGSTLGGIDWRELRDTGRRPTESQ